MLIARPSSGFAIWVPVLGPVLSVVLATVIVVLPPSAVGGMWWVLLGLCLLGWLLGAAELRWARRVGDHVDVRGLARFERLSAARTRVVVCPGPGPWVNVELRYGVLSVVLVNAAPHGRDRAQARARRIAAALDLPAD